MGAIRLAVCTRVEPSLCKGRRARSALQNGYVGLLARECSPITDEASRLALAVSVSAGHLWHLQSCVGAREPCTGVPAVLWSGLGVLTGVQ